MTAGILETEAKVELVLLTEDEPFLECEGNDCEHPAEYSWTCRCGSVVLSCARCATDLVRDQQLFKVFCVHCDSPLPIPVNWMPL